MPALNQLVWPNILLLHEIICYEILMFDERFGFGYANE